MSDVRVPWWTKTWVGLCILVALVIGAFFIVHIPQVGNLLTRWTGQDNEAGGHYGAWSGFWGAIQPTLIITAVVVYWHSSCHLAGCWLPGRHKTSDGAVKLCRFHHPDIRGRKLTDEVVRELHELGHWRLHNAPRS